MRKGNLKERIARREAAAKIRQSPPPIEIDNILAAPISEVEMLTTIGRMTLKHNRAVRVATALQNQVAALQAEQQKAEQPS